MKFGGARNSRMPQLDPEGDSPQQKRASNPRDTAHCSTLARVSENGGSSMTSAHGVVFSPGRPRESFPVSQENGTRGGGGATKGVVVRPSKKE